METELRERKRRRKEEVATKYDTCEMLVRRTKREDEERYCEP